MTVVKPNIQMTMEEILSIVMKMMMVNMMKVLMNIHSRELGQLIVTLTREIIVVTIQHEN